MELILWLIAIYFVFAALTFATGAWVRRSIPMPWSTIIHGALFWPYFLWFVVTRRA